jgi:hypothetical protein
MDRLWLCLAALAFIGALSVAQTPEPEPPIRTMQDVDKFLSKPLSDKDLLQARTYELQECRAQNLRLQHDLGLHREFRLRIFVGFIGVGAGLLIAFFVLRLLRRAWSVSLAGKRLAVLVLGAAWISAVVLVEGSNEYLSRHPVDLAVAVTVYSIPVALFSGIGVWWLGKRSSAV